MPRTQMLPSCRSLALAALVLCVCSSACREPRPDPAARPVYPAADEAIAPQPRPLPAPTGRIQVCGILDESKPDYTFNSAKIEEFEVDPQGLVQHLPGPFSMVLLDRDNRVLAEEQFGAMWGHAARIGEGGEIECHPVSVPFSCVNLPFVPGGEAVEVRHGDAVIERYARTPNPPQVRITEPADDAELPRTGKLMLAWEASDADGDVLSHSIYYRSGASDAGPGPWSVVIGDFPETTIELDAALFPPGPAPEVMVLTTDRFNTARAIVRLQGTSRHAPR